MAIVWNQMFLSLLLAKHAPDDRLDEVLPLADAVIALVSKGSVYGGKALCARALVALRRGDLATAEADARVAMTSLSVMPTMAPLAYGILLQVLLRQGRIAEARELADKGVALLTTLGGTGGTELGLRLAVLAVMKAAGDADGTARALQAAQQQVDIRAADIKDPATRARFLTLRPSE